MKKSVKRTIFNATVISSSAIALGATAAAIIGNGLNPRQVNKIIEEINSNRQNVDNNIQTLDSNKNSVDTLRNAINNSKTKLNEYMTNYEKLDKDEYKNYKRIQQALSKFKTEIEELETKITQSEETLKTNIDTINKIVKKARDTSDQAIEKLNNTSDINFPGLSEANEELQKAMNELKEAKKRAEVMDSKTHIDDLALKAKDVEKAEKHVADLIKTFNEWTNEQRHTAYLEELNKHIKLLNAKINDSAKLNEHLPTISAFITDFEKKNIVANDAHNYINSLTEKLPENILNSNNELKQVIANSNTKIEELKAKLSKIKAEIDTNLNELANKQQSALDKINSTDDFDILVEEYNSSNQRLQKDIKNIEDRINQSKYDDALNQLSKLKTDEQNNSNIALEKLHKNIESTLAHAIYLSPEQVEAFKAQIKSEKSVDKLKEIKNDINLINEKEKAKKQLKDGYELFNNQFKQEAFNKIDQATNKDQIDEIILQINELNTDKQAAKTKINNEFNFLSSEQKHSFIDELISASSKEKVKEIIDKAQALQDDKKSKYSQIDSLKNLTTNDKQRFLEDIKNANSATKTPNNTPQKVLDKAIELNNAKKSAIDNIQKLESLNSAQKELLEQQINGASTKAEIDQITQKANELDKIKKQVKEHINSLSTQYISEEEKNSLIKKVENINSIENDANNQFNDIKSEADNLNNGKKLLVDEINKFNFNEETKNEFINKIKESDLESAKDLKNKVLELNNLKQQVQSLINDPKNFVSDERKQKLTKDLTDAKTEEEITKVRNDATLEKKKHEAIELAKKILNDKPEELKQVTEEINSKNNERSIDAIISRIKGDKLQSLKLEAESKVEKLEFISENEKQRIIADIEKVNTENHTEIDNIVKRITEKNTEKQNVFDSIKNSELFDKEYINQNIKKLITNNDEKTAYTKVKDDFVKLENQKKEIKNKFDQSNNNFNSLGQNDIKKLTKELINATTSEQINKVEHDANVLNDFKKDLIDKVNKLSNVNNEKQQTIQKIKDASTREEAQKIYDDLALKSKQNDSTLNIQKHEYLSNNEKSKYIEQIKKATNNKITSILQEAKTLNDKKKAQAEKIRNLDNTNSLLKQETKNSSINSIKSTDGEQNAINKYGEVKNIFDKETALFNSINDAKNNNQIPDSAKNQLINKLKENDTEQNISDVQAEFNKWKENYPKHKAAISSLNNVKKLIAELSNEKSDQIIKKQVNNIQEIINKNMLQNNETVDKIIEKNNRLYSNEITSKFNNLSQDVEKLFESYILNDLDNKMKDKNELSSLNQKLKNDVNRLNNIKLELSKTFTGHQFNSNQFNKAITKSQEVEKWYAEKIDLITKHNELNKEVSETRYLKNKDKEKWTNKIGIERLKKDHNTEAFNKLKSEIDKEMAANKKIIDKYLDSLNSYKDTIHRIKEYDNIIGDRDLKIANQSIVQNNENIISALESEYESNFNNNLLNIKTQSIDKNNDAMTQYKSSLENVKVYLDKHARNENIKNSAWHEFKHWVDFKNPELLRRLGTNGVKELGQYTEAIKEASKVSILNVKRLVFKKEIIELIGNGKWSLTGEVWWNNHTIMHISYAWIENPSANNQRTKVHLDDRWYSPRYLHFNINWNADEGHKTDAVRSRQPNHWDYFPKGIIFSTGDEDNIKYKLIVDQRTWYGVVTIPEHHNYWNNTAHRITYTTEKDQSKWFNESHLKLV
ncbi:GA module-containing protein [Mycoplasmopsis bovigenitalium]|uniref:GA module-containing protein n=1 Tax=Mycoplasmopsis bovigenitalium TaxID=2112 RepID=UPI001556886C|nr:GA module-containing protein [Mycoplasmopsis bovigenitalium]